MPARIMKQVAQSHARQLALCGELEALADSLPANVDRQRCLHLARAVCRTVTEAQAVEETVLLPAVEAAGLAQPAMRETADRLRWEHMSDLCVAEEIREALLSLGKGEARAPAPEALGYLLRGFFEGVRRHIAFERELLAPQFLAGAVSRSAS
ncbi:MAG: hemerythrin domain-containing protein [Mesorhizobium amorphae]|nr:MAG: hemerythrin domain-containing protein [Mesorhizobium amorphae]